MATVERATAQPFPKPCLMKPVAARRDFLGPTWDFQFGASVFNLEPRAGLVEPRRAQGWAHRHRWRTRTVTNSGSWKAPGPGLVILCSSQATEDESPRVYDGRAKNHEPLPAAATAIVPFGILLRTPRLPASQEGQLLNTQ